MFLTFIVPLTTRLLLERLWDFLVLRLKVWFWYFKHDVKLTLWAGSLLVLKTFQIFFFNDFGLMNLWQRQDNHPPPPLPPAAVLSVSHWQISVWEGLSVATSPGSLEAVGVQLPWKPHMWQPESLLPKPSASDHSRAPFKLFSIFSRFLQTSCRPISNRQSPFFVKLTKPAESLEQEVQTSSTNCQTDAWIKSLF